MESLLHQPGPAILVAVVASAEGRWAAELTAPNAEARAARARLLQALDTGDTSLRPGLEGPRVIGVATLVSWEYARDKASSQDMHVLMMASAAFGRQTRRGIPHFLEHRVVAAAILEEPVPLPSFTSWAAKPGSWPAVLDSSTAVAVDTRQALLTIGPSAGTRMPASQALAIWSSCSKTPRPPSRPGQPGQLWPRH